MREPAVSDAPLGQCSVDQFMRRYWQRRPLLIRQAFPAFEPPLTMAETRELATRDDVESRLITSQDGDWTLRHGPFERTRIPSARRSGWTLLVQGVDRQHDAMHALLGRFRFISDARLDDVMVSIAGDGGGVGPHLDSYDVFLLQAQGRRRWSIGPVGTAAGPGLSAPTLVDGLPLKILADFRPTEQWTLEAGDMLYLPPGWAHDGVADGPCMTYSIGFRAPSRHEFLRAWLADSADLIGGADSRYRDAGALASATPAQIPATLAEQLGTWAREWQPSARELDRFIGRYLTEPDRSVWFDGAASVEDDDDNDDDDNDLGDDDTDTVAGHDALAQARVLRLDRRSRAAYRGRDFFINGECFAGAASVLLRRLADRRMLDAAELARALARDETAALLRQWLSFGWLVAEEAGAA